MGQVQQGGSDVLPLGTSGIDENEFVVLRELLTRLAAVGLNNPAASLLAIPGGGSLGQALINIVSGAAGWDYAIHNPVFGRKWQYWQVQSFATTSFVGAGAPAPTPFGSPASTNQDLAAPHQRLALRDNPVGINVVGGLQFCNGNGQTRPGWRPRIRGLFRAPASLATRRWWFDIFVAPGGSMNAITPLDGASAGSALHHIGLAYDSTVSPNFLLQSGDGTNRSGINTGLAIVAGQDYWIELDWSVAGILTCRIYVGEPTAIPTVIQKTTNLSIAAVQMDIEVSDTSFIAGTTNGFERSQIMLDQN